VDQSILTPVRHIFNSLNDTAYGRISFTSNKTSITPEVTDKSEELFFPDQLVYFSSNEGDKVEDEIKLIVEFKPPHKLTLAMLRAGLRPVDIDEEVINNATVPSPG